MTAVYWKLAAAGDGGVVSVTPGDASNAAAWVVRYVRPGGYPPNPAVATATSTHGSATAATSVAAGGVTTSAVNATAMSVVGQAQATTPLSLSTPNGYTLQNKTSANGLSFGIADKLVATSGTASGSVTWSSNPTSATWAWSGLAFN
jgi:hypothetical protein